MNLGIVVSLALLVAQASNVPEGGARVGGPCAYKEFPGTCRVTVVENDGTAQFEFKGTVEGRPVRVKGNKSNREMKKGEARPCSLQFITDGTCTPCLFSIGECGPEAWDLFRQTR